MREGWQEFLPGPKPSNREQRVHVDAPNAAVLVAQSIYEFGLDSISSIDEIVLLCIGTDRSTGDSLGPLVGTRMSERSSNGFTILGTLDNPVHATNLCETMDWVRRHYNNPFVIAVDASLGRTDSVGYITVGKGSLRPGAGVNKSLPAVGNIFVTGVVNVGGFMEYLVLQNTRLSLVFRMAGVVAHGIAQGISSLVGQQPATCSHP